MAAREKSRVNREASKKVAAAVASADDEDDEYDAEYDDEYGDYGDEEEKEAPQEDYGDEEIVDGKTDEIIVAASNENDEAEKKPFAGSKLTPAQ